MAGAGLAELAWSAGRSLRSTRDGAVAPALRGIVALLIVTVIVVAGRIGPDGAALSLSRDDIAIDVLDHWQSPQSGGRYPARWRLRVPSVHLSVEIIPTVPHQELITRRSTQVTYWEGSVIITLPYIRFVRGAIGLATRFGQRWRATWTTRICDMLRGGTRRTVIITWIVQFFRTAHPVLAYVHLAPVLRGGRFRSITVLPLPMT